MALTQITTDGIKDGTITGTDLTTNVDLVDNQKLRLGTGNDLQIYHDGSNSYLQNSTGLLYVRGGGDWLALQAENGENSIICKPNGTVELYHDNGKKFETLTDGVSIPNDNDKLKIGASQDLYLWHNGSTGNSNISNVTGDLFIQGNNGSGTAVNQIAVRSNAAVELNYQGTKKFETLSDGVKLNGILHWDVSNSGRAIELLDGQKIFLGNGTDLQIYHQSSDNNSYIVESGSGSLMIQGDIINLGNVGTTEYYVRCFENGSVQLRYDNSTKLETSSSGVTITGDANWFDNGKAEFGNSADLQIWHVAGANSYIRNTANNLYLLSTNSVQIGSTAADSSAQEISGKFFRNGAVELYHDNSKKFETTSQGVYSGGIIKGGSYFQGGASGTASNNWHFGAEGNGEFRFYSGDYGAGNLKQTINSNGDILAGSNNSQDLGSSSIRWRNVYTNDLNLSNEGSSNDVDGTWGSYTIQEGAEDLFLVNKRSGKKYKFNLTEVN